MFRKILLPTDGSRYSASAARFAADVAAHHEGAVQPVVAVEYQYIGGDDLPQEMSAAIRGRIQGRAQKALEQANTLIKENGAETLGGKILEGPPVEAILREAEDGEYDLIVMGSRGLNLEDGYDHAMGSVAERVLHRTPCPVLVIRAQPRP